jgi:DNA sulfur modification protein DndB
MSELTELTELVVEKKFDQLEAAQQHAGMEVANTGGFSVPVVIFRQGKRINMTGALPLNWLRSRLEPRSAKKNGKLRDAKNALNRPEIPEHARAIGKYLKENYAGRYILPPLTLNIQQRVNLYTVDFQSEVRPGYLVIPATAKLGITDGQHRRSGVIHALDELDQDGSEELARHGVAVMVTCETETAQIHQDFADCSRTKALPPSLLAVFDMRNPANRLVTDLEDRCVLFRGRIDPSSKTLSKGSTYLFLANQLRQVIKELLTGSYAMPDLEFEKRARELLKTEDLYQKALTKFADYLNYLTEVIPIWKEISVLPVDGLEVSQVPAKRQEGWVCLTATGLNMIGRVGHDLFSKGEKDWKSCVAKFADMDWKRDAEFWADNIVQNGKILTAQAPLKVAYAKTLARIGRSQPTLIS